MARTRLLVVALALPACAETTTTDVYLRDVTRVALLAAGGAPGGGLPAGAGVAEAPLAAGTLATGAATSTEYAVTATRAADGALGLRWATRLALVHGERYAVVPASGEMHLTNVPARRVAPPGSPAGPTLRIPSCTGLTAVHVRGGTAGYDVAAQVPCDDSLDVPFVIETPWSNVARIRQRIEPERVAVAAVMGAASVFLGVLFGVPFLLAGAGERSPGPSVFTTLGWIFIGAAGAVDLAGLPTLLAPSHDDPVYPAGGAAR